jgi:hypothetical protein
MDASWAAFLAASWALDTQALNFDGSGSFEAGSAPELVRAEATSQTIVAAVIRPRTSILIVIPILRVKRQFDGSIR